MTGWNRVNDGTNEPPKLAIEQSWWAMSGLGQDGKEWSTEEKVERIAEAGFTGISGFVPAQAEAAKWHRLLDRYKLSFSGLAYPLKAQDMEGPLQAAKAFGRVRYMNIQLMDAFVVGEEAQRLLEGVLEACERAGIPGFIETHRGTVTQDLIRTAQYVEQLPQLQLTIDLSHYVVAGELTGGGSERAERLFDRLLARTAAIHARVSNGEQVQIDIGPDGDHPMAGHFARWWRKGMEQWLKQAMPGDVLPFVTELGPPRNYAITRIDAEGREVEISDRWQQALLLKRIAEEQWRQARSRP